MSGLTTKSHFAVESQDSLALKRHALCLLVVEGGLRNGDHSERPTATFTTSDKAVGLHGGPSVSLRSCAVGSGQMTIGEFLAQIPVLLLSTRVMSPAIEGSGAKLT